MSSSDSIRNTIEKLKLAEKATIEVHPNRTKLRDLVHHAIINHFPKANTINLAINPVKEISNYWSGNGRYNKVKFGQNDYYITKQIAVRVGSTMWFSGSNVNCDTLMAFQGNGQAEAGIAVHSYAFKAAFVEAGTITTDEINADVRRIRAAQAAARRQRQDQQPQQENHFLKKEPIFEENYDIKNSLYESYKLIKAVAFQAIKESDFTFEKESAGHYDTDQIIVNDEQMRFAMVCGWGLTDYLPIAHAAFELEDELTNLAKSNPVS